MQGTIKQYNYEKEKYYQEHSKNHHGPNTIPTIGYHWRYYIADGTKPQVGRADLSHIETKGKVTSYDEKSGVVCTDAGEILIRG